MIQKHVAIIGGGLAGTEAAYQLSKRNIKITLYEMRPVMKSPIHDTPFMGELVCSNSLGSEEITSASGLLKNELFELDSFFLNTVTPYRVPSGMSFSIDRVQAAQAIDNAVCSLPHITVVREEIKTIPTHFDAVIIASGPLTSQSFTETIQTITKRRHLHFYDATSPIIKAETINMDLVFRASRYDKGAPDFLNVPLYETQYFDLITALNSAECVPLHDVDSPIYYESCLPVEEIARRGPLSLAFGPLKPVGLIDPRSGKQPFAVVQLRQDDMFRHFYQMVGFQTRLKWPEQNRIFTSLPGLEAAKFERYGRMHRNTFINAPLIIDEYFRCKTQHNLFICGQLSGVEGYLESIASGLITGLYLYHQLNNSHINPIPIETAIGSLVRAIALGDWKSFSPTNFTYGLLPVDQTAKKGTKKEQKFQKAQRALECLKKWKIQNSI